jgi:hypothetical protein
VEHSSSSHGNPEAKKEKEGLRTRLYRERGIQEITPKDMPLVTHFLQLGPTSYSFYHLPIVH